MFKVTAGVVNLLGIVDMSSAMASITVGQTTSNFYDIAASSISAETEDVLWVSVGELGVTPRRIKLNLGALDNTGATSTPITSFQAISATGGNFIGVEFVNDNNLGYAISYGSRTSGGSLAYVFHVYSTGTVNAATATLAKTSQANLARSATYISNSGVSDVAVRRHADNTRTVYFLATNNGLGAFKSATPLPRFPYFFQRYASKRPKYFNLGNGIRD